ncbi:MAG TPA: SIS domain-containing protein [Chloroflexota bacterium]|nr:SIS domain-containing protein [Chloroflexota bacterium]
MAEDYFGQVAELTRSLDLLALQRVVSVLRDARERGACVFIFGNGGSAATASHMAADLTNAPRRAGQKPLRVFSLADNMACLSALANDEGYEHTFASQLDAHVRAGDVVVAISASGNSPNLLGAIELAKARGATTVGLVGFDGGDLRHLAEEVVFVASPIGAYGPVEDVHLMLGHIITTCLCNA